MKSRWLLFVSFMLVLVAALLGSCGGSSYPYREPAETGDGWPSAQLSEVGLDTGPFVDLMDQVPADNDWAVHGILVVKDGRLVFKEYFSGYRFDCDDDQFRGERVEPPKTTTTTDSVVAERLRGSGGALE